MCEIAVRRALETAGVAASELDGILVVTVMPDEVNFCHDVAEDLADGVVQLGSGELVPIAAIDAGVHYRAQLMRL